MDVTVVHLINVEVQQLEGMGQVLTVRECCGEQQRVGSIYTHVRGELEIKWCE